MTPQQALRLADTIRMQRGAQGESAFEAMICLYTNWDFFPAFDSHGKQEHIFEFLDFMAEWTKALTQAAHDLDKAVPAKKPKKKAFKHQEETQDVFQ